MAVVKIDLQIILTLLFQESEGADCTGLCVHLLPVVVDLPVAISSPHSYTVAPIEMLFAIFKKVDINPRKVATNKG